MEPVLLVAVVMLFASSVIVDGIVQALGHAIGPAFRLVDDLIHRPVLYDTSLSYGSRPQPTRSAVLR